MRMVNYFIKSCLRLYLANVLCSLLVLFISKNLIAMPIEIDSGKAKTEFVAIGRPAMLRVHGEAQGLMSHLSLEHQTLSGEIILKLSEFKTGIETRDEHMKKKYLEVDKFPEATLIIKDLNLPDFKAGEKRDLNFKADLNLHGQRKNIDVSGNIEALSDRNYKIHAQSKLKLSDFHIEIPQYAGITVADLVDFEVLFQTKSLSQ